MVDVMSDEMKMTELNCLVIGGSGFIGSHLVQKLVASGRNVTVLDRNKAVIPFNSDRVIYKQGDFSEPDLITQLVADHDEIIHLAYATIPNTSFDNPLVDLDQNLHPAVQLFDIVARKGARLLMVSSGGTVYGEAISTPIEEDHPTRPIAPYGVTKLTLERYAYLYAVTRGLKVTCVRPSNPYGEGQLPFVGQGFISTAMATAMQGKPITIFGEQGTVRDYIYIDDLVEGMLVALDHGGINETYNIGSSSGRSNLDVVNAMRPLLQNLGVNIRLEYMQARPFDVKVNVLDCRRLKKLGWQPYIDFEDGLKRTHDWIMHHYVE